MEAGIVGLPNVGKSTLFNALTSTQNAQAANYPFCTIEPNEGIVSVPDDRLGRITRFIPPQKTIPAFIKLVDIAGIVRGASQGEGLGNKFLSHIREVDAILQVVRCFRDDDVIHVSGQVDPLADIATIDTELLLADAETLEGSRSKAERAARLGDKEARLRLETIDLALEHLRTDRPLRCCPFSPAQAAVVRGMGLLTAKPVLYVANVAENDLDGAGELAQRVKEHARHSGAGVVCVCARIEAEIAELDPADRPAMLEAVGLREPALAALAREAYRTLGLQSFFTAGEKEVRAWTIPAGATAPQAAGVIHSDFERGFIRAEIFSLEDLELHHSEAAIRQAGKLRTEGKSYVMRDGDICHFLFNV